MRMLQEQLHLGHPVCGKNNNFSDKFFYEQQKSSDSHYESKNLRSSLPHLLYHDYVG